MPSRLLGLADPAAQQADYASVQAPQPEDTQDVRVIAIFVILVASLIGGLVPLFTKCFRNSTHPATLILRATSAGVILSLALIHVIPDGSSDLEGVVDYPVGPCCVVFGVLVMVIVENISRNFLSGVEGSMQHAVAGEAMHAHTADHAHSHDHDVSVSKVMVNATHHDGHEGHTHSCMAVNNAANWGSNSQVSKIKSQVMAYMFELACVVHSFLIGLALGVTVGSRSQAVALLIALVFHQGLEGIGLGSVLVHADFARFKSVIMIFTYSIMTPLGVAIGMAIADTYDPEGLTALTVQGVLNSLSGGLLLYISLVQLIAEDFTRAEQGQQGSSWLVRIGTYVALFVGAGCMAMLAYWA